MTGGLFIALYDEKSLELYLDKGVYGFLMTPVMTPKPTAQSKHYAILADYACSREGTDVFFFLKRKIVYGGKIYGNKEVGSFQGFQSDRERNQIANFTYIDYNTNIEISDDAPADYVNKFREKLGEDGYKRTCDANALPENFENLSYPEFLSQRRMLMAGIIKKAYLKLCQ